MSCRFHGGGVEPQGAALEVVATAVAGPRGGVVHQYDDLILVQHVAARKAQLVDIHVVARLSHFQHLIDIEGHRRAV